jgi:hypothetical protein
MEQKFVNAVAWGLCGYVAATVLSFFGVLFVAQQTSEPDGLSQEFARRPALVYAPFLGISGFVVGCIIGAKRMSARHARNEHSRSNPADLSRQTPGRQKGRASDPT